MPYSAEFQRLAWQFFYFKYFCLLPSLLCWVKVYQTLWLTVAIPFVILCISIMCLLVCILLMQGNFISSIIFENKMPRTKCTISAEGILMTKIERHANIIFLLFCIIPLQKMRLRISRNHLLASFSHNPNMLFASVFAVVCWSEAFVFDLFTVVLLSLFWKVLVNVEFVSV